MWLSRGLKSFLYVWAKVREDVSVSQHDLTIGEALYQASKDRFSGTDGREKYVCGVPPRLGNDARVVSVSPVAEGASSSNPLKISNATKSFQMNSFPLSATFKQSNSAADFVSDDSDALQNGYIDKGKVIHYLFSKIRYAEDVSSALLNVQAQGLIAEEGHFEELKNFVKDRLEKSEAREWFTRQWRVYNECSILVRDKDGNLKTHRPDRVITDGETTLVIDYKCGKKRRTTSGRSMNIAISSGQWATRMSKASYGISIMTKLSPARRKIGSLKNRDAHRQGRSRSLKMPNSTC